MASLLTNASDINDGNLQDAVAQMTGNASAAAAAEKLADDEYYIEPREDPNEEIVRGFYDTFRKLKNKWSNKGNRNDDLVVEISDATHAYEEWKNEVRPDRDNNFGNPKYERRYKRWNTKFANFLKKVRPRKYDSYTDPEKDEYRTIKSKKPKSFYTMLDNLVTKLDGESRNWFPSSSDESSGGGRRTRKKRGGGPEAAAADEAAPKIEWVIENTEGRINSFVNSDVPQRGDGFNNMIQQMRNRISDGGFWIVEWNEARDVHDDYNHYHLAWDDEDNEPPDLIRFPFPPLPTQAGGKKRKKRKRKKKKSRKKRGGRKLNLFLSEINNRLRDVEKRGEEREDEIRSNSAEIRDNDAAIIGNGDDITENAVDIGVIKSYINYKLNNTLENAATPLDQWQGHLRSIDRRSHQEPPSLIDRQILTNANMGGGMKKTRKMKGGHHLYKRLGVSKYASQKTIKKAYNKIKKNKKITNKVKYAYKILSKKKTRKQYNNKYVKHKKLKRKKNKR